MAMLLIFPTRVPFLAAEPHPSHPKRTRLYAHSLTFARVRASDLPEIARTLVQPNSNDQVR